MRTTRCFSLLLVSGMIATSVAVGAPAAQAAPVFTDAITVLDPSASTYNSGPGCTVTSAGGTEPSVPVVENGPAVSAATSQAATYANTGTPTDTGTYSAQASGSASMTSAGGNPKTLDLSVTASGQLSNALGTSTCNRGGYAGLEFEFTFTVAQAGFLDLTLHNDGSGYGEVFIRNALSSSDNPYVDSYGYGLKFNSSSRVYLPAGTYAGDFEAETYTSQTTSVTKSGTTTMHGSFVTVGSQSVPAAGKGVGYVALPAARSCATHSLNPSIITAKKKAKKIQQVAFFVNDVQVLAKKKPKRSTVFVVPVSDAVDSVLTTEVTLFPARKGKKSKVLEATSSYTACST